MRPDYTDIQTVYASQVYGTFFGVFATFHVQDIPNNNVERLLTSVDFYLINYKGPLNLKLNANFDKPTRISTLQADKPYSGHKFILKVQHTPDSQAYQPKVTLKLKDMYPTEGGIKFAQNEFFITERKTIPLAGEGSDTTNLANAFVNGIFDSEFFTRDGAYGVANKRIDYTSGKDLMFQPPGSLGYGSCTPSNNKITF